MRRTIQLLVSALAVMFVLAPSAAHADTTGYWYTGYNSSGAAAAKGQPTLVTGQRDADIRLRMQDTRSDGHCARAMIGWIRTNGTVTYSGVVSECNGVLSTKNFGGPDLNLTVSVELYLWSGPAGSARWAGKPFCNQARISNGACGKYFYSV